MTALYGKRALIRSGTDKIVGKATIKAEDQETSKRIHYIEENKIKISTGVRIANLVLRSSSEAASPKNRPLRASNH